MQIFSCEKQKFIVFLTEKYGNSFCIIQSSTLREENQRLKF